MSKPTRAQKLAKKYAGYFTDHAHIVHAKDAYLAGYAQAKRDAVSAVKYWDLEVEGKRGKMQFKVGLELAKLIKGLK